MNIYQMNSYTTLYGGFYEGSITALEVLKYGKNGIGTLEGADGEVIILDGVVYHGNSDGQVREVRPDEQMPYAAVVSGTFDDSYSLSAVSSDFPQEIVEKFSTQDLAQAIKISGQFNRVEITSKKPGNPTGRPYVEILAEQPHFVRETISGTLVGIWAPKALSGLYGDGFHLHFLSDDHQFGAHAASFSLKQGELQLASLTHLTQDFSDALIAK
ncbi:MAG: acetolactate decarboxylase [Streptococcaceae bacterium]|jgi:acetolactate decarboxylase|nr:acetolactate decarboxylase [Streptococcaceae bacterium]